MKAGSEDLTVLGSVRGQLASVLWAAGPADRGGVAILFLPSVQGDGSSDCPTQPLPELSRSLRCREEEMSSKLSHSFKRGLTPHPVGRLPWFLGRELRNASPSTSCTQ